MRFRIRTLLLLMATVAGLLSANLTKEEGAELGHVNYASVTRPDCGMSIFGEQHGWPWRFSTAALSPDDSDDFVFDRNHWIPLLGDVAVAVVILVGVALSSESIFNRKK